MHATSCPSAEQLQQLAAGQLPDHPAAELEQHLLNCDACTQRTTELNLADTLIATLQSAGNELPQRTPEEAARLERLMTSLSGLFAPPVEATLLSDQLVPDSGSCDPFQELTDELGSAWRPPESADELGRLGGYRILKLLGAGGMGAVFLAEDTQLHRRVALKLMRPRAATNSGAKERFLREARAAAALRHDHIITIYQVGEDACVPFLAMEYLEGESLEDRLRRSAPLPIADVLRLGRQIAEGLAVAHAKGLIHRDIKPANVWLEAVTDRVKILDFGLARQQEGEEQLTQLGAILGTPAYMSPEQAQGLPLDARSDLFSLGGVLYRMVTGRLPFPGTNPISVLRSLAVDEPPVPSTLNPETPAALSDLIVALLQKERERRIGTAAEVVQRLSGIVAEPSVAAPALPPPTPPQKPRSPAVWWAGGAALLLAAGVIVITITRPDGSKTTIETAGDSQIGIVHKAALGDSPGAKTPSSASPSGTNAPRSVWHGWPADAPTPAIAPFNAEQAQRHQEAWAKHLGVPVEYTNSLGMKFRLIPPGEFAVGSSGEELDRTRNLLVKQHTEEWQKKWDVAHLMTEAPQRRVVLTKPFYLGVSEVTLGTFQAYVERSVAKTDADREGFGERNGPIGEQTTAGPGMTWRRTGSDPLLAVGFLSWNDAQAFCRYLSREFQGEYRLPTEAEWEYACRAGTTTTYSVGDELTTASAAIKDSPVRRAMVFSPNPFGLYDMHGLKFEYCSDAYYGSAEELDATVDPHKTSRTDYYVARGGALYEDELSARSARRIPGTADSRSSSSGVRVAVSVETVKAALAGKRSDVVSPFDALDPAAIPAVEKYDWQPKELVSVIGTHSHHRWRPCFSVEQLPDNKRVLTVDWTGVKTIAEIDTGRQLMTWAPALGEDATIRYCLSPAGDRLGGGGGIWDITRSPLERVLDLPTLCTVMAFTADGRGMYLGERGSLQDSDFTLRRRAIDGAVVPRGGVERCRAYAIARDDAMVAVATDSEHPVQIYDFSQDPQQLKLTLPAETGCVKADDLSSVQNTPLAFDPAGRLLAVGKDGTLRWWDVSGAAASVLAEVPDVGPQCVAVSPDGKKLVLWGNTSGVRVWGLDQLQITWRTQQLLAPQFDANLQLVNVSPDSRRLATAHLNGTVRFWDLADPNRPGNEIFVSLPQPVGRCFNRQVAASADGLVISQSTDLRIRVWQAQAAAWKAAEIRDLPTVEIYRSLALSPNGEWLLTIDERNLHVSSLKTEPPQLVGRWQFEQRAEAAAFAPDGTTIYVSERDSTPTEPNRGRLWKGTWTGTEFRDFQVVASAEVSHSLVVGPPGQWLLGSRRANDHLGSPYERFTKWRVGTDGLTGGRSFEISSPAIPVMSSAGNRLAVGQGPSKIVAWNLSAQESDAQVEIDLDGSWNRSLALSPDGRRIAAVISGDGDIVVRDVETGQIVRDIHMPGMVGQVLFTPDGRHLLTANSNGTIYVLRLAEK